ncbi:unnamed protein product [Owenia fusiformis]|uniref:Dendritic cell-specific transmembrane protein-like domain-containing protein n=1 Tax=Owenia fusiformis TaxID=6347 RepID=A0A8S4PM04_OWEFU|nr:unnamed protein product [Owenia fusiformis]
MIPQFTRNSQLNNDKSNKCKSKGMRCIVNLLTHPCINALLLVLMLTFLVEILDTGPITNTFENVKKIPGSISCVGTMVIHMVNQSTPNRNKIYEDVAKRTATLPIDVLKEVIDEPKLAVERIISEFKLVKIDISNINFNITVNNITFSSNDIQDYANDVYSTHHITYPNLTGSESLFTIADKVSDVFEHTTDFVRQLPTIVIIVQIVLGIFVFLIGCWSVIGCLRAEKQPERVVRSQAISSVSTIFEKVIALKQEFSTLIWGLCVIMTFVIFTLLLILLDSVVYQTLDVIHNEANISMLINGGSSIQIVLNDTSPRIRQFLYKEAPMLFDSNLTTLKYSLGVNTKDCLPDASPPFHENTSNLVSLIVLLIITVILIILQSFWGRIQDYIENRCC